MILLPLMLGAINGHIPVFVYGDVPYPLGHRWSECAKCYWQQLRRTWNV